VTPRTPRDDEDALDPVEAADVLADDAFDDVEDELDGFTEEDAETGEPLDSAAVDSEGDSEGDAEGDAESGTADGAEDAEAVDDDAEEGSAGLAAVAAFDDEEPEVIAVPSGGEDDVDGLREGEFVCRGCYMAKRDTQLAHADRQLCRDCA